MATSRRGMRTARIANSKSRNSVVEASTIAAWTESHDLTATLAKRSRPSRVSVSCQGPSGNSSHGVPGVVNARGSAASANGRARVARRRT